MPRGSLVHVTAHNTLRSPENTEQPALLSISGAVGEGFAVSNYQPTYNENKTDLIYKIFLIIKTNKN